MLQFKSCRSLWLLLALMLPLLNGCRTMTTTAVDIHASSAWLVLPVSNLSATPMAGESAATMLETQLRERGIHNLDVYRPTEKLTLTSVLRGGETLSTAMVWARERGYRYALTGTVHEWQYKSGPDREPVVGLSLKLLDLEASDAAREVLWQGSNAKTGWGFANLTALAGSVIDELLNGLRINTAADVGAQDSAASGPEQTDRLH